MSWTTSEIFTNPVEKTVSYMKTTAPFRDRAFLLKIRDEVEEEYLKYMTLPHEGLIICREPYYLTEWTDESEIPDKDFWDKETIHRWYELTNLDLTITTPQMINNSIDDDLYDEDFSTLSISIDFLKYLKFISIMSNVPVSFYKCFYWGGEIVEAISWVFDPRLKEDVVYLCQESYNNEGIFVWKGSNKDFISDGDVLTATLSHHNVKIQQGYFRPHASGFDWNRFKLYL